MPPAAPAPEAARRSFRLELDPLRVHHVALAVGQLDPQPVAARRRDAALVVAPVPDVAHPLPRIEGDVGREGPNWLEVAPDDRDGRVRIRLADEEHDLGLVADPVAV